MESSQHHHESLSADREKSPALVGGLRTDTLTESVVILLTLTAVQRVVGFGRAVLFCRWLEPEELGQWDMAFGFLLLAAPLAVLALPGTFGRYIEHYRQRGQLRALLRNVGLVCVVLAVPAVVLVYAARGWFSQLVFGTPAQSDLIVLLAVSLAAVIAYNTQVELFNALRNARFVAGLHLTNSLLFASVGVGLLLAWRATAASVVIAYGTSCLICSVVAFGRLRWAWRVMPPDGAALPRRQLWSKLAPFASWIVLVSLLTNLFEIADRYMIIHYSRLSATEALALVGEYHSSRVVPLLLVSITAMLGAMITPHLSHDWEAGRRRQVAARLSLFRKLLAFGLTAGGVAVMFAAPLLFGVAFGGKFAGGLVVLPWTLTYCIWLGITMVSHNYLWCAEKAHLASAALLVGLVVNVCLNLLLLPRLGLLGAVLATTLANAVALVLVLWFSHLLGFGVDRGTRVILAAPLAICLGPWVALLVLAVIVLEAVRSDRLLSCEEKRRIAEGWGHCSAKFKGMWMSRQPLVSNENF